ncbi:hypothetical protein KR018_002007 [Drosophila ironensis]|nr:hypothetical protein KR018_002007 [Drosophila ironensis]
MPSRLNAFQTFLPRSPGHWVKFFNLAGIPSPAAASYAHMFVENRIQDNMLLELNKEYLREMGVTLMGDIIAILRHAKTVSEQNARDQVLTPPTPPKPQPKPVTVSPGAGAAKNKASPPAKPARRVLPEHEGKYKVTLPSGTTERSKQIMAKREKLYSDRVSSSKKSDIFSRLQKTSGEDEAQEGIVSSSGESSVRVHISDGKKTADTPTVFARLGGRQTKQDGEATLTKEIKSILKNTQRTTKNSPIVKAKKVAAPAVRTQQKVMLVHKVPLKGGEDDSMDEDSMAEEDLDISSGESVDGDLMGNEKFVKFASTAEVREIAPQSSYKPQHGKNLANNIKNRLVSKLHATKKTYNLKASPAKKPQGRFSPVKGKTIRMRSDEFFTRQDTQPVHRRLGYKPNSAPTRTAPAPPQRQNWQSEHQQRKYNGPRRYNSMNAGHSKPRGSSGSVFDRLGFNNSM